MLDSSITSKLKMGSSLLYSVAPVSMCLQHFGFCCTKKRNTICFESPIVGVNVCVRQTFQRGTACTLSSTPSAFLTNPQMSLGDAARQKQSSCILELTTYCYNVLKKQLSSVSWHKAVRTQALSHSIKVAMGMHCWEGKIVFLLAWLFESTEQLYVC